MRERNSRVMVRCLPPQLSEEAFFATVEKFRPTIDFWYFRPGIFKERKSVDALAYINFTSDQSAKVFTEQYNGHIFVTSKGREQKAAVERAPYQKMPKLRQKPDPRENTIESDPEYKRFVESLNKPAAPTPSVESLLDARLEASEPPKMTPLVEFLLAKKTLKGRTSAATAERAERRRRAPEVKAAERAAKEEARKKRAEKLAAAKQRKSGKAKRDADERKPAERASKERSKEPKAKPGESGGATEKAAGGKGRPSAGLWQIRKHLEPGAVQIKSRDDASSSSSASASAASSSAAAAPGAAAQAASAGDNKSERQHAGGGSRRDAQPTHASASAQHRHPQPPKILQKRPPQASVPATAAPAESPAASGLSSEAPGTPAGGRGGHEGGGRGRGEYRGGRGHRGGRGRGYAPKPP